MSVRTEASRQQAIRGSILHFVEDPAEHDVQGTFEYHEDGVLIVEDGYIAKVGNAQELLPTLMGRLMHTRTPS